MIVTRLAVLWLLSERPHHGYRIKKILRDDALGFWFAIEDASIYSMLGSLVKEGYAKKLVTEQEGKRPTRTLYSITPAGRRHYEDLLRQAWRDPASHTDPIQIALAASGDLSEEEVDQLAGERLRALEQRLAALQALVQSAPAVEMVHRESARLEGEIAWLRAWYSKRRKQS